MNKPAATTFASDKTFSPALWLRGAHLQTIWSPLFRNQPLPDRQRERLILPDGDFINLDWYGPDAPDKPLIILLHGLTGCSQSKYIIGLQTALALQGMPSVAMNFRGCGGEPNDLTTGYHSGISSDLKLVIQSLKQRWPARQLMATGYSLGGNVLLKYLGEEGEDSQLSAAVAVSVPFELDQCSLRINEGFSKVYRDRFLKDMVAYIEAKKQHFRMQGWSDRLNTLEQLGTLDKLSTFHDYDDHVTAPLHGFQSAEDYYSRCSSRNWLSTIDTPTLILQSADDPFLYPHSVPETSELSASTTLELTQGGGHVGFIGRNGLRNEYWLEQRIPRFFTGAGQINFPGWC
ncbi:hydrolase [Parendozoicomonas haliclonae]|uniref:Putative hydrolase n=1 Tax=Parendozoicomonas haliclonae TaxID=1960125 RepID=A0A1X7ALN6_9GAMM|nr:hydrolase [Parendozoicomonas haliclonae]SMA48579.1 putative hydrolase [Parendozoicomonas haliclonae]